MRLPASFGSLMSLDLTDYSDWGRWLKMMRTILASTNGPLLDWPFIYSQLGEANYDPTFIKRARLVNNVEVPVAALCEARYWRQYLRLPPRFVAVLAKSNIGPFEEDAELVLSLLGNKALMASLTKEVSDTLSMPSLD